MNTRQLVNELNAGGGVGANLGPHGRPIVTTRHTHAPSHVRVVQVNPLAALDHARITGIPVVVTGHVVRVPGGVVVGRRVQYRAHYPAHPPVVEEVSDDDEVAERVAAERKARKEAKRLKEREAAERRAAEREAERERRREEEEYRRALEVSLREERERRERLERLERRERRERLELATQSMGDNPPKLRWASAPRPPPKFEPEDEVEAEREAKAKLDVIVFDPTKYARGEDIFGDEALEALNLGSNFTRSWAPGGVIATDTEALRDLIVCNQHRHLTVIAKDQHSDDAVDVVDEILCNWRYRHIQISLILIGGAVRGMMMMNGRFHERISSVILTGSGSCGNHTLAKIPNDPRFLVYWNTRDTLTDHGSYPESLLSRAQAHREFRLPYLMDLFLLSGWEEKEIDPVASLEKVRQDPNVRLLHSSG